MNPALYRRARELFVRAIELEPERRAEFLDAECGGEAELRAEVASLLEAHEHDPGFDSLHGPARARGAPSPVSLPERIGSYRILEVLGEGGMGVVYLAEQDAPRRRVALKVLHAGIATPARMKRLEHEAQILGRLHHPGIAQVYEAGHADAGAGPQPFLAMELVLGRTLAEHADAAGLGASGRVELLAKVGRAVHHAHEQGVIHRDLKPANILVDEHGTPKVLDFGIARATAEDLRTRTALTGAGEILGTIPYMSPEQIEGDPERIDARADVYALGVIGYELLSGRLPIDVARKSLPEAARAIRDEEPAFLGTIDRSLRGDLETIFAKALEKEPERRYASALEFAEELERWLGEEPIVARPPSTIYQLSKFARRNRVLVLGVAGVFVALVAGIAGTSWQAYRANAETKRALEAGEVAKREAARLKQSYAFIDETLRSADPEVLGREVKVVDVLDRMAAEVPRRFADDPETEATVRLTIGLTYFTLGELDKAEENLGKSRELHTRLSGAASPTAAEATYMLGRVAMSRGRNAEAEALMREARESYGGRLGESDGNVLGITRYLAEAVGKQGRLDEAEAMLRELLATNEGALPAADPVRITALGHLGMILKSRGALDEASEMLERALSLQEPFGPTHPRTLFLLGELSSTRHAQGRAAEALELDTRIAEARERVLGSDHLNTLTAWNNLASNHMQLGHHAEAAALWARVLAVRERKLGRFHVNTLSTRMNLFLANHRLGKNEDEDRQFQELLEDIPKTDGGERRDTVEARRNLGAVRFEQRRFAEAEALGREALTIARERLELNPVVAADYEQFLGQCLLELGRYDEAEERLVASSATMATAFGDADPRTRFGLGQLAELYHRWGHADSEAEIRRRLEPAR